MKRRALLSLTVPPLYASTSPHAVASAGPDVTATAAGAFGSRSGSDGLLLDLAFSFRKLGEQAKAIDAELDELCGSVYEEREQEYYAVREAQDRILDRMAKLRPASLSGLQAVAGVCREELADQGPGAPEPYQPLLLALVDGLLALRPA
ncbi:hypothetical protein JYK14_02915 [Siccirubricoccus sp. KC 17139]|uniref:Uncharacterized protein n=1 Tax=Siccirubricoccus soli TaxID=2899147 RepID=A0ABT1CZP3_9PROT|nr:hypothetical protein [Siccirubricoccus soli]MCO6415128.1 hypothetical protein [Siccirubricoccus soli]MCP2681259.1 hypothetical protein [Siccirubricoccus soli]